MSGKNLTFKLVMDADTKGFDAGTKASKDNWESFISLLKKEADGLKAASVETGKEVSKIVPDDLQKKADQAKGKLGEVSQAAGELQGQAVQAAGKIDGLGSELQDTANKANKAGFEIGGAIPGDAVQLAEMLGNKFFSAAKEIESLGDKSTISAGELRAMSSAGEQGLNELNLALKAAQAELVRLQSTDGTLQDIEIAKQRVLSIQDAINEASSAFNYYQGVAINAMKGVDGATQSAINQVQRFSAVDLTGVVGEAQTATRAIESMGDGASLSTKEIERIGSIGTNSINALERELQQANTELRALNNSSDAVSLEKFNEATLKVNSLEDALGITKTAFTEFNTKASSAMQNVTTSTDKASGSAKQAGHAIYDALGIKPPTVVDDAIAALTKKLEDFKANSKLPAEEVERVTKITEQQIEKLKSELNGVEPAAQKANSGVSTLSKGMDGAKFAVTALVGALATIGVGLGLRELAQAADSYTNLSARINIATSDGGNFQQAMAGVHQVALMTNSSLDATAGLFTKVNDVGKQMGMTQQQSLDLVKTINMAIQTGGGSAQASEAAIVQLTQALQSGVLRGDEFNSIMEQAPGISKALAQSLGVTTGELRKMAENGELSAEKVIKALQDQSAAIEADYAKFPTTIGNALARIATQWQILIGEMDQANGSSAAVANALLIIADNLGILKVFFDDVAAGVGWFQEKLSEIDPSTIDALSSTLSSAYDTVKSLISNLAGIAETAWSAFTSTLDAIAPLFNAILNGKEEVSGLTTLFNVFKIALGVVSDAATGLNIALKLLLAGIEFISGGIYSLSASVLDFLGFDALAAQAQNASDALFRQAEKNASDANRLALESKGATKAAIEDIRKTEVEKNAERVADSQQTLEQLKAQEEKHKADYKAISDERVKLEQQLYDARKSGNQAAIDLAVKGLTDLDAKEKAYQAESQKITEAKIQAAQDWVDAQLMAADGTQKAADLVTQKTLQTTLAAQGLKAEFTTTGGVIVSAMNTGVGAVSNVDNALTKARQGATALGIDLDNALNRVSEKFAASKTNLDNFALGMEDLGLEGVAATNALYLGWSKWLETAKNQAEIDAAKVKLQDFGKTGQLSTQQVEIGLQAIKRAAQELPDSVSPVEAAFERLGIKTKEQLKLAADLAMNDFNTIMKSGEATQDGLQRAYEETIRLAYASGDAQVIAAANAKAAYLGLEVQLDATGKATVSKLGEMQQAAVATQRTIQQVNNSSSTSSSTPSDEKSDDDDYWEEFKQKIADRTAKSNAAAQARRSSSVGGVKAPIGTDSALMAQPVIPDAPMIASGFDIKPFEGATPTQTVEIKIDMGTGQTATVNAAPDQADALTQMMRELEKIKRSS